MSLDFVLLVLYFCYVQSFRYNTLRDFTPEIDRTDPIVIDRTCNLKPAAGPCRANLQMFYFKPSSMNCSTFRWGGCQGNGNRFNTYSDCMSNCVGVSSYKVRPNWCDLSFDYGYCFGQLERWYYDSLYQVCKQGIYSGCGGNQNNFRTRKQCNDACIHGRMNIIDFRTNDNKKKVVKNLRTTNETMVIEKYKQNNTTEYTKATKN